VPSVFAGQVQGEDMIDLVGGGQLQVALDIQTLLDGDQFHVIGDVSADLVVHSLEHQEMILLEFCEDVYHDDRGGQDI